MIMLVSLVLLTIFGPQTPNPASAAQIQANENVRELNLAGIAQLQADAEKGDVAAQMKLGNAYLRAEGVPKNDELAARWFRKAADQGDPAAENQMGNMYRSGIGLSKNKEEAFRWYEKAVRHGDLTAMFNLGTCYYNGDGVASNEYTAYAWFLLAQDAGETEADDAAKRSGSTMSKRETADALLLISEMYNKGEQLAKDDAQSLRWLRKAAEISSRAKVTLAVRLMVGQQPEQHYAEAMELCRAAAGEDATGQRCVGYMYRHGLGMKKDPNEALKWYKNAEAGHNPLAAYELGEMYASGEGTTVDRPEAFVMFLKAEMMGVNGALQKARSIYEQMDKSELKKTNSKLVERRLDPKKVVAALQDSSPPRSLR